MVGQGRHHYRGDLGSIKVKGKSKGKDPFKDVEKSLENYKKALLTEYYKELSRRLLSPISAEPYIQEILKVLQEMQQEYWGGADQTILKEDRTQFGLKEHEMLVRLEVIKNFQNAAKTIQTGSENVNIVLLSNEFMGIGANSGSNGIPWLAYFLSGSLDVDLIWINPDIYEALKNEPAPGALGRFGSGYMWHLSPDNAPWFNAKLKSAGISETYDSLKHPQSGKPGRDWFSGIWESVSFEQLIRQPALQAAQERAVLKSA